MVYQGVGSKFVFIHQLRCFNQHHTPTLHQFKHLVLVVLYFAKNCWNLKPNTSFQKHRNKQIKAIICIYFFFMTLQLRNMTERGKARELRQHKHGALSMAGWEADILDSSASYAERLWSFKKNILRGFVGCWKVLWLWHFTDLTSFN